jgi:hypothetical protein
VSGRGEAGRQERVGEGGRDEGGRDEGEKLFRGEFRVEVGWELV